MKKTLILCGLLLAVSAPAALAAGVNLNWNDCTAGGGLLNQAFLCNTNTGANTMIGSYVSPVNIDSMCANEMVLDLESASTPLPLWWNYQSGGCRVGALSRDFNFTGGPFNCADHWVGKVGISGLGYTVGYSGPNTARIVMVAALASADCTGPDPFTGITAGTEYYSFKLLVGRAKTVGASVCGGCQDPVCIVLNTIKLQSPSRGTTPREVVLVTPDTQGHVTWQGGVIAAPGCPEATPTKSRTWGAVKTLYR